MSGQADQGPPVAVARPQVADPIPVDALERAVLMCDGQVIHAHHLPPSLQTAEASGTITRVSLRDAVGAYEKDLIQDALKSTRGNRAKAARLLSTTERVLNYKVRNYTIDVARFRG
jgi:Nif-specific regulatory protein